MKTAAKLLDAARASSTYAPTGVARVRTSNGHAVVTWDRVSKCYDVGTDARSLVQGKRGDVLATLVDLLA